MRLGYGLWLVFSACTLVNLDDLNDGTGATGSTGTTSGTGSTVATTSTTSSVASSTSTTASSASTGTGGSLGPYADAVLASQPMAYYRFEDDPDGFVVSDEVGDHDGTYGGSAGRATASGIPSDPGGAAIAFDGGSHVNLGTDFEFAPREPFSLELWVRVPQVTSLEFVLGNEDGNKPARIGYTIVTYANASIGIERWGINMAGMNVSAGASSAPGALQVDTWTYFVVTFDGDVHRAYVDNVVGATFNSGLDMADDGIDFFLGSNGSNTNPLQGDIDDFAIYDRVLTAAEVEAHWNAAN